MRLMRLVGVLGVVAAGGAIAAAGCGGSDDTTTPPPGDGDCAQIEPACQGGGCVALADNAGKTSFGLRMSQLTVTRPAALTTDIVDNIVGGGVRMNLETCRLTGLGTFNWLLQFDTTAGMVKTGGALPRVNPREGYCFLNDTFGGTAIAPVNIATTTDATGAMSAEIGDIQVPIFEDLTASGLPIILPLKGARVTQQVLSADNNCIGTYNAEGLLPVDRCLPSKDIPAFIDGATLEGYIILEDADQVLVADVNQTLCVLLGGTAAGDGGSPIRCKRDATGAIELKGDFCSTTQSAGGCQDSFMLGATFAASAVEITGDCP